MKISKISLICFFAVCYSLNGFSQAALVKQAVKQEAKQAAKAGVKQAVKAEIKGAVKTEVKQAVKQKVKQAVKQEVKQVAKAEAKQIVKKEAKQAVKGEAKQLAEAESKRVATGEVKKASFSSYKKSAINPNAKATSANARTLEASLNKDALKKWEQFAGVSVEKKEILLKDLQLKPELASTFNNNPQLIQTYCNFINSPRYRTDIAMLRYGNYNASKSSMMYARGPRNKRWLTGDDLILEDKAGSTIITQRGTGRLLGKLEGNLKDGYVVKIHGNSDPALLDLFPMRNTTYQYGNCTWITDNYGRPCIVKMKANSGISVGGRDKDFIGRVKRFKTDYDVDGNPVSASGTKYDDIAGHIVPDSWGGPSNGINIVPQNAAMNNTGLWKSSELQGLNLAKQGNAVERTIVLKYSDNITQRPSSFSITQTVNGKYDVVHGVEMKEIELVNAVL